MLIRDHFQNFKSYNLPKAQLIIADMHMVQVQHGISMAIIQKVKVNLLAKSSSQPMKNSILPSLCIFAVK